MQLQPDNITEKGWKDMGVGHLSIKTKEGANKATKESKPTIVIRNDVCSFNILSYLAFVFCELHQKILPIFASASHISHIPISNLCFGLS